MPSIKDLKKRIVSTKNTQQTTKAMKMVSAAKLRRAQEAITNQRPYAKRIRELIGEVAAIVGESGSKLIRAPGTTEEGKSRRVLLMLVTSDRGLCGAFNGNVIKAAQRWVSANQDSCERIELGFVGRRGYDFFKNRKVNLGQYYPECGGKITFDKANKLAHALVERFLSDEVNEIKFVYNEFKNAVTQSVQVEDFLPIGKVETATEEQAPLIFIVKPEPKVLLNELLEKTFAIQAFRILLESQAGEHGARMSAMENATKNAGEMIRKLTLQYNKQRQAGITKELLEIISGSESQKS